MKPFRALVTTFDDPDRIDDCTTMYARPDHEEEDHDCDCIRDEPQLLNHSCGEVQCRARGRRVA